MQQGAIGITAGLAATTILPAALCALLYYLGTRRHVFDTLSRTTRQILIGLIFGGAAILATQFGTDVGGAILNVRSAVPLCAGLIFGGPAGIIAGIIGGAWRFLAGLYGIGTYTALACSVSCVLSGFFAAILRVYVFDRRIPVWYYGLAAGIFIEVVDMLLIFITNMSDVDTAFIFVQACAVPMICLNGAAVMLAALFVSMLGRKKKTRTEPHQLAQTFERWLAVVVLGAFLAATGFTWALQTRLSQSAAASELETAIADVEHDTLFAAQRSLLDSAEWVRRAAEITTVKDMNRFLKTIAWEYDIAEASIIDENGIILYSSNDSYLGYDMSSAPQSAEFLVLLRGETEYVQDFGPIAVDENVERMYAAVAMPEGGFVQTGIDGKELRENLIVWVKSVASDRHAGENGYVFVADKGGQIVTGSERLAARTLAEAGLPPGEKRPEAGTFFTASLGGVPSYITYDEFEEYLVFGAVPVSEVYLQRDASVYVSAFMQITIFTVLFMLVLYLLKRLIVDNIREINARLGEITKGDLDVVVDVRGNEEFASLSDDINLTVATLKNYIALEAARVDEELALARSIQLSSLPSVFPPFPEHSEFELYAQARPAKEVGGDFYDFFLLGDEHLALVIADVSGKGIPAALFMMTSKTLIKNLAESGLPVEEVLRRANEQLCRNNEDDMFVTCWLGIVNLRTGLLRFANAGHNPPAIREGSDARFRLLKTRPGFVLGGLDGISYRKNEMQLLPGSQLYLYTDGVPEAENESKELYGDQRLLECLDAHVEEDPMTLCQSVADSVDAYTGSEPQFDDMTMIAFAYKGTAGVRTCELTLDISAETTAKALAFFDELAKEQELARKPKAQLSVAIDEICSNIVRDSAAKTLSVTVIFKPGRVMLRFEDDGIPYDPTKRPDPDVSLSAEERTLGGLGLFMVKKTMDEVSYEYVEGHNILVIVKNTDTN